jgi:hypothetical protein
VPVASVTVAAEAFMAVADSMVVAFTAAGSVVATEVVTGAVVA